MTVISSLITMNPNLSLVKSTHSAEGVLTGTRENAASCQLAENAPHTVTVPTTEGGAPEEILKVCCFDKIALQRINYESGKLLGSPHHRHESWGRELANLGKSCRSLIGA